MTNMRRPLPDIPELIINPIDQPGMGCLKNIFMIQICLGTGGVLKRRGWMAYASSLCEIVSGLVSGWVSEWARGLVGIAHTEQIGELRAYHVTPVLNLPWPLYAWLSRYMCVWVYVSYRLSTPLDLRDTSISSYHQLASPPFTTQPSLSHDKYPQLFTISFTILRLPTSTAVAGPWTDHISLSDEACVFLRYWYPSVE